MSVLDVTRHDSDCRRAWAQQEPQCGLFHFVSTLTLLDLWIPVRKQIKGPDNPTSQLLPTMSKKCCCGGGEGRKDKGRGGGKMVCDKVVCVKDGV